MAGLACALVHYKSMVAMASSLVPYSFKCTDNVHGERIFSKADLLGLNNLPLSSFNTQSSDLVPRCGF